MLGMLAYATYVEPVTKTCFENTADGTHLQYYVEPPIYYYALARARSPHWPGKQVELSRILGTYCTTLSRPTV